MNVATLLNAQLRGKRCGVYSSDLRVRILATGLTTYPDVRRRGEDGVWTVERASSGQTIRLGSVACELPVDEVYRDELTPTA